MSEVYKKQNKGIDALEMYELHITMRDSLNNDEAKKALIIQQTSFEYQQQKVLDEEQHLLGVVTRTALIQAMHSGNEPAGSN